jgi:Cysteine-rich secretory protein family
VLEETNRFRATERLAPVVSSRELAAAAQTFAHFMAKTAKYGHTADGRQPAERASAHGYDYCIVSENLAYLYRSAGYDAASLAADMVEGWKKSPEHRKSMLDPAVTQTGVGIAQDEKGRYYGVQMFGRPKASAIRFSVQNRAAREIEYRMGERRFSLPPRAERSHSVCRPLGITIGSFSARPSDGATYIVTGGLEVSVQR